ncbi:MAG: 16S rRNA (guanine(527)-N(7))-methyltransferase RsmG [Rhodobacteraceae bacterium]|nr:16S rRNA (guanine(527)-N(7))-methyltransferase RsmG [Paracoccaceae bacterium]
MTGETIRSADDFQKYFDVSRETMRRLEEYGQLLQKWTTKINLVSRSSLDVMWHRHFADSAQLWAHRPLNQGSWVDIGSGAGFPGLVMAIMASEVEPDLKFTLIESDQRKCSFLMTVCHQLGLSVEILPIRIEKLHDRRFDIISARALSSLTDLLKMADQLANKDAICLFPKGINFNSELTEARKSWHIEAKAIPSITDQNSIILCIESFSRVN